MTNPHVARKVRKLECSVKTACGGLSGDALDTLADAVLWPPRHDRAKVLYQLGSVLGQNVRSARLEID